MNKVKMIAPAEAVKISENVMRKFGFYRVDKSDVSRYFSKKGTGFKIRVSDHLHNKPDPAILVQVVFDYQTIVPDVEVRIKQAIEKFEGILRNRRAKAKNIAKTLLSD